MLLSTLLWTFPSKCVTELLNHIWKYQLKTYSNNKVIIISIILMNDEGIIKNIHLQYP